MLKLIIIEVEQCMLSLVYGKLILTFFMQLVKKKNVDLIVAWSGSIGVCVCVSKNIVINSRYK